MVTKGIVEQILDNYLIKVRLPVYDRTTFASVSVPNQNLNDATICTLPNTRLNLRKGDIVFVTFEDNDFAKPVILGCLCSEYLSNSLAETTLNSLRVQVDTHLSADTYIGDVLPSDIVCISGAAGNFQGQLNLLSAEIESLNKRVYDLEHPIRKASVIGLGSEDVTNVLFSKDVDFPNSFEEWTDSNSNVFIKIPTMYRTIDAIDDGQITAFTVSTAPISEDSQPYSVFVKPNGEVMPYVCIGKYTSGDDTKLVSKPRMSPLAMKPSVAREAAIVNGAGYMQFDWQFYKLLADLMLLISQKVNFQDGSSEITDYLGISDMNANMFVDGVAPFVETEGMGWAVCSDPSKYVNQPNATSDGYVVASFDPPSSANNISKIGYDVSIPFFNFPTSTVTDASYSTYYCCGYNGQVTTSRQIIFAVGAQSNINGIWAVAPRLTWTFSTYARLCYRPLHLSV